ncbi:MAG: RdgB/HAM1 family non-canonical purine NTP pyrophosphatase [Deltaproteobacteria bacterium]|nr:RdgB/HAM1 family non-canonical purine NTP pyrophosphatase [Deltaproteobacteria bacterium]NIS76078.1 RdgB/HAM1 family non-canonical purine NTP pyrophosphatase [Deltaproteobacteria bacterium]
MKDIVLGTLNPGKTREMREILEPFGLTILSLRDFPPILPPVEVGHSFRENAEIKASCYSLETALPCIADDSGLSVDVLGGEPGIYSSRYAGEGASDEDNIERLLEVLAGHPRPWAARFVCSAAYAEEGRVVAVCDGVLAGEIVPDRRGSSGFGYDPVFHLPERGVTVAELAMEEKNRISHRRKAMEGLMMQLKEKNVIRY